MQRDCRKETFLTLAATLDFPNSIPWFYSDDSCKFSSSINGSLACTRIYSLVALIVSMNELADCSISQLTFLILFEGGLIEWPIFLPIVEAVIHTLVLIVLSSLIVVTSFLQMVKWCDGSYSSSNDDCRHNCFRRDHQESLVFCIKRWLLYCTTGWLTCVSPRRIIVLLSNFMVLLQ